MIFGLFFVPGSYDLPYILAWKTLLIALQSIKILFTVVNRKDPHTCEARTRLIQTEKMLPFFLNEFEVCQLLQNFKFTDSKVSV